MPIRGSRGSAGLRYRPFLLGVAQLTFRETASGQQTIQEKRWAAAIEDAIVPVDWTQALDLEIPLTDFEDQPEKGAEFAPLPAAAASVKQYTAWSRDFSTWIYQNQSLTLWHSAELRLTSVPGESERDFRLRTQQAAREARDQAVDLLKQKYTVRYNSLNEKIRRGDQAVDREKEQARQQGMQTAISVGATIFSALLGKKKISASSVGKATTAVRGASRSLKEKADVDRSRETVETYQTQLKSLEAEFNAEAETMTARYEQAAENLTTRTMRLAKKDIQVKALVLLWMPWRHLTDGNQEAAWS
jgi:hypothetical protein